MEERDIHHEKERYTKELERINFLKKNRETILEWLRQKKLRNKSQTSTLERQLRYIRRFDFWFKKDFRKVTQKEMEKVIENLQDGKYKRADNGKSYEGRGVANTKAEIKAFFGWIIKNYNIKDLDISFIDTSSKEEEIPALSMDIEVKKLMDSSPLQYKFIIRLLTDGGFRIEEFLNMTWGDLTFDNELGCYMARIRISKTKPRTISLPLSTQEINDFKGSFDKINENEFVIKLTYNAVRKYMNALGKKVLKKNVFCHLLRHTSCTFYANKLNHYQMCKRYGWEFNSPMSTRYIDRNGVMERETAKIIRRDEVGELKMKVSRQEVENRVMKENFEIELEKQKVESRETKEALESKMGELEKMDAFFFRAMENPRFISRFKKVLEASMIKDMIKESNLSKEDEEKARKSMKTFKWKSDEEYEKEKIISKNSKIKQEKRSEGVNVIKS